MTISDSSDIMTGHYNKVDPVISQTRTGQSVPGTGCGYQAPPSRAASVTALTQVSNLMVTLNSSVNFIIYCIYGEKFRRLFCYLFCKTCGGGQEENRHIQRYTTTRGGIVNDRSQAYEMSTTRPSASYVNNTSLTEITSSNLKVPTHEVNEHFI